MQFLCAIRRGFFLAVFGCCLAANIACAFNQLEVDQPSVTVAPRISTVGAPRTVFANGCTGPAVVDEAEVASGRLIVRINPTAFNCALSPGSLTYVPRTVGILTVRMISPDGRVVAETSMETAAAVRSTVNLDGMWFDPLTNGSGISFHHSSGPDSIFGNWFMYGAAPQGAPRWYSLQSMQWTSGGGVLVGTAYAAAAAAQPSCAAGDDCPRPAVLVGPAGSVSIAVIDSNSLRAEGIDRYGRVAFVSRLKRLEF